jgi:hypothetical protein
MKKRKNNLAALTKACNDILELSKKYSHIWRNNSIPLVWGFIAQDETFYINVSKYGNNFVYDGKNFCNKKEGMGAKKAALEINTTYKNYKITPKSLKESFREELRKNLGEYLAEKELEDLKI